MATTKKKSTVQKRIEMEAKRIPSVRFDIICGGCWLAAEASAKGPSLLLPDHWSDVVDRKYPQVRYFACSAGCADRLLESIRKASVAPEVLPPVHAVRRKVR